MYGVAISGVGSREQVEALLEQVVQYQPPGCLTTLGWSTTHGRSSDNSLDRRYGLLRYFYQGKEMMVRCAGVEYLAHLFVRPHNYSATLIKQIDDTYRVAGDCLSGVQLNFPKGNLDLLPEDVVEISQRHPGKHLVLPLGRSIMRRLLANDSDTTEALLGLTQPGVGVDTLLLDNGRGIGDGLSIEELTSCLRLLQSWHVQVRVAGRISPTNLSVPRAIMQRAPALPFSWEAESALRDQHDNLDLAKACHYLRQSYGLMRERPI